MHKAPGAPLTITLYDENSEEKATFTRGFIPWRILKTAVRLSKALDTSNLSEDDIDALAGLVVDVFSNQFSVEDLNDGADLSEMMAVLQNIIARAGSLANPTPPPG